MRTPPCRWATQPGRTHTGAGETTPNPSSHAYPERCGTPDHSVDTVALEANASRSQFPTPSLATPSCGLLVGGPDSQVCQRGLVTHFAALQSFTSNAESPSSMMRTATQAT